MQADIEERQSQEPPKLGRYKFTPQLVHVLATEDLTGSLRRLKTVPVIAKDRFKSMQKRGMIHVRHWPTYVLFMVPEAIISNFMICVVS